MIDFTGRHFTKLLILQAVRWYLSYPLSYRHVEELMKERVIKVDHSTINRWVIKYSKELEIVFSNSFRKYGSYISWKMDETYLKLKGKDVYLYRAIDKHGDTLEFMVSEKRDEKASRKFFKKTIGKHGLPDKLNVDKSGANEAALLTINIFLFLLGIWLTYGIEIRQNKYLNNLIEQDHRSIKRLIRPMMGFKSWDSMDSTIAGYELVNMIKKGQHIYAENMTVWDQFYSIAG
ncbi:IS6 family transposase [Francisella halioticida]|uniref:IS6 family transposase n=2 Tax=Francisella halioticida TaxID=549298 RepID=A0ABN5B2Q7_9GAMM|nr:IS6 family transposase [Francisella halioticida]ASG68922.1 IS6 family transposase [Francisella halioticida]ASG68939.1 IS6 family transposase [Francisella halioticida]